MTDLAPSLAIMRCGRPTTAITGVTMRHPWLGEYSFESVRQDRRVYYRLVHNRVGTGSLTDAEHACATIIYWREKGWLRHQA